MNQIQERTNELLQEEIRRVKERLNKFLFPCPHCQRAISDEHFGADKRAFAYIKELGGRIVEEEIISRWGNYRSTILEEIKNRKIYEEFPEVKKLSEIIKKNEESLKNYERKISELNSAEHIDNLPTVKRIQAEKKELDNKYSKKIDDLQLQNQELQKQIVAKQEEIKNLVLREKGQAKGQDFEKWFYEELLKVFDGRDRIMDISRGQMAIGKRADFLQEVLTENEPKEVAGRIIYETKNTQKWENSWIDKLEKDMISHHADYGFIIATCEENKIIRSAETTDPRKKIYVSGDNINVFLAIKIVRELLITKHNLMKKTDNSADKEQKLKKIEEWVSNKLPNYIIDLQKQLENQENAANSIIDKANKIKKFKDEICKLIMKSINEELKKHLE